MFLFRFKRVFSLRGFRRSCSAPKFLRHPDKIANVVWLSLIIGSCSMLWFLGSQTESPTRMNTWKHLKQCARTGWIQCDGASCQMFPCLHGGSAFLDMSLPGILLQSRSRVSAHPGTWCYCLEYRPWAVDGCTLRQPVCFRSWYSTPTGTCTQLAGYLPFPLAKLKCPHPEFDRHEWNHQKKHSTAQPVQREGVPKLWRCGTRPSQITHRWPLMASVGCLGLGRFVDVTVCSCLLRLFGLQNFGQTTRLRQKKRKWSWKQTLKRQNPSKRKSPTRVCMFILI